LPVIEHGAQRASLSRSLRLTVAALVTVFAVSVGVMANPGPATAASGPKVVIVVGPVGSQTREYRASARRYATVARTYGARVVEVYSPNATWTKVKSAARGANILVYLGHGNGWPSPYGPFQKNTKDGMGLNSRSGHGNSNLKYWGERYVARSLELAKNSVVILNRLCYASGNSEWGRANPSKTTAKKRVDNYGAGFLRANARAVFAEATSSISHTLRALLTSDATVDSIFMSHPAASGKRDFRFSSSRTKGYRAHMDPPKAGKYWRSVIGNLSLTARQVRGG
jgi:hypothetical protein